MYSTASEAQIPNVEVNLSKFVCRGDIELEVLISNLVHENDEFF
jgi:hypothetical protein